MHRVRSIPENGCSSPAPPRQRITEVVASDERLPDQIHDRAQARGASGIGRPERTELAGGRPGFRRRFDGGHHADEVQQLTAVYPVHDRAAFRTEPDMTVRGHVEMRGPRLGNQRPPRDDSGELQLLLTEY